MTTEDVLPEREDDDSLLSAEEIETGLVGLRQSGFPPAETEPFLDALISSCRNAEPALAEIVQHLDEATLRRQLHARLSGTTLPPSPALESGNALRERLISELIARRCQVTSGDGWRVSMLDGTRVDSMLEPLLDEESEVRLGRLVLLVVGIMTMRDHPPIAPSY